MEVGRKPDAVIIGHQTGAQRVLPIPGTWVDGKSGGLIHDQKVVILPADIHRAVKGHNAGGGLVIGQDRNGLPGMNQITGVNVLTVQQQAMRAVLGAADGGSGQAVAAENGVYPVPLFFLSNSKIKIMQGFPLPSLPVQQNALGVDVNEAGIIVPQIKKNDIPAG